MTTTDLPNDLTQRGWKLITRAPDRMFAVSTSWGCTATLGNIDAVIRQARSLTVWCERMNRKKTKPQPQE